MYLHYLLWWQIPLLILAILLATLAAGMFAVLAPQYLEIPDLRAEEIIAATLQFISEENLKQISTLPGDELEKRLKDFYKAKQIFENDPGIIEQIPRLQTVFDNVNQSYDVANEKVVVQRESYAREQERIEELERQQREAHRDRLQKDAEIRAQQARARAAAKEKADREAAEHEKRRMDWLNRERKRARFTGGCPPDNRYNPPRCRPGYSIKVTLNPTPDGFDGIIWKPSDARYDTVETKWCYSSVQEAEAEAGKYRFRRPNNNQGNRIP